MATANIHSKYIIKCPRNVDPDQVNTENFKEFIPPNIRATQVKGLTLKSFLVIGKLLINFLKVRSSTFINLKQKDLIFHVFVGNEEDYQDNKKRHELRKQIEKYKPRNTIILTEKAACEQAEHFWIFEYQIMCDCILQPPTGFLGPET
jgi:hypothetical protein